MCFIKYNRFSFYSILYRILRNPAAVDAQCYLNRVWYEAVKALKKLWHCNYCWGVSFMAKKSKKSIHKKSKKTVSKGSRLICKECGLELNVVDDCDCVSPCDVMCCGEQMVVSC
jgi:hypothetical protein